MDGSVFSDLKKKKGKIWVYMWERLCSCFCQVDEEIQMGCENRTGETKTAGVQRHEKEQQSLINLSPLAVPHSSLTITATRITCFFSVHPHL